MKKSIFFVLIASLLAFNLGFGQANLLNARVPQEVGINDELANAVMTKPIAYGYVDDRDVLWQKNDLGDH